MKSRVHRKYKTKYRVSNWADFDRALVQRRRHHSVDLAGCHRILETGTIRQATRPAQVRPPDGAVGALRARPRAFFVVAPARSGARLEACESPTVLVPALVGRSAPVDDDFGDTDDDASYADPTSAGISAST